MRLQPTVEAEDVIYSFTPADNGAGPLWCHGSTIVARHGDQVFVTALETLPEHQPLHNCRWCLYARTPGGWSLVHRDTTGRTREPSPLALLECGDLLVSANPTLTEPGAYSGPARPTVFRFCAERPETPPAVELPVWRGTPAFTEHSYRTVTADRGRSEVLYMQNVGYDVAHLSHRDGQGHWRGAGTLAWPVVAGGGGASQPLRLCYPNVAMRNRAVHFFGVGDIVEPVPQWRQAKFEITRREWDYVFRRLFYASTPDVTAEPFGGWVEIASREATAGHLHNGDLHVDGSGVVHLVWSETSVDERLRDRFFPGQRLVHSLEYLALRDGSPLVRQTLASADEGEDVLRPQLGRIHVLADGQPIVLASFSRNLPDSALPAVAYRIAPLDGQAPSWVDVPFARPMPGTFLTSTGRGGSPPGNRIDVVGMVPGAQPQLGYARVRLS